MCIINAITALLTIYITTELNKLYFSLLFVIYVLINAFES